MHQFIYPSMSPIKPSINLTINVNLTNHPSIFYWYIQHPHLCPSIHPSIYLSIHSYICPSICLIFHLSTYLSIHPPTHLFLYIQLSICLPIYVSIHIHPLPTTHLIVHTFIHACILSLSSIPVYSSIHPIHLHLYIQLFIYLIICCHIHT